MEFSAVQYIAKKNINDTLSYYKQLVFVKIDDEGGGDGNNDNAKVYIEMSSNGKGGHKGLSIMMPFDDLVKNTSVKAYYEMSRVAIGKPNLDPKYYGSEDPEKCQADSDYLFIDTIYIIEGVNYMEAKKGNTYNSFNRKALKELYGLNVASAAEIAEFNANYDAKFGDEPTATATYTALVNNL
jgi:hypothetical protein